jgi:hypothetical protein
MHSRTKTSQLLTLLLHLLAAAAASAAAVGQWQLNGTLPNATHTSAAPSSVTFSRLLLIFWNIALCEGVVHTGVCVCVPPLRLVSHVTLLSTFLPSLPVGMPHHPMPGRVDGMRPLTLLDEVGGKAIVHLKIIRCSFDVMKTWT